MTNNSKEQLSQLLSDLGQQKILERIETQNPTEEQCALLLGQLQNFDNVYFGGVKAYLKKAKQLVTDFKESVLEVPEVMTLPKQITRITLGPEYELFEDIGASHLGEVAVVLVAGGLGERLGSKQIKISITCEIITGISFMELYLEYLKVYSIHSGKKIHLLIMTSDDTHIKTLEFLKNFNFSEYVDIQIEKQDKVPAMSDLDATLDINDNWEVQTKPHGHGDVHFLIKQSGVIDKWTADGVKYVYFIQDTNPFSLPSLPVILGSTIQSKSLLTFTGVQRKPGEAIGALVLDEKGFTYNIEYSIFDNFFKKNNRQEEITETGFSVYPGNINVFLLEINEYKRALEGINLMKEFINIKFDKTDPKKIASSWRVECLMQDIAFSITNPERIGICFFDRNMAFTTCKNNIATGQICSSKGLPSETIVQCENDIYLRNFMLLKHCGMTYKSQNLSRSLENIEESDRLVEKIRLVPVPRIFIHPSFGVLVKDIRESIKNLTLDGNGDLVLVLKGKINLNNCYLNNVSLLIDNCDKTKHFRFENFRFNGRPEDVLKFVSVSEVEKKDGDLRGYRVDDFGKMTKIINF